MPKFVTRHFSYVPAAALPVLPETSLEALRKRVPGEICDEHPRARGIVGKVIPIPAEYWAGGGARQHRGEKFDCLVVAYVPAGTRADERWYFHDHRPEFDAETALCPLTYTSLGIALGYVPPVGEVSGGEAEEKGEEVDDTLIEVSEEEQTDGETPVAKILSM